ncbi:MAG: HlyD family efflux transporter periplasmic adaptor subunit [Reinekea sp.]
MKNAVYKFVLPLLILAAGVGAVALMNSSASSAKRLAPGTQQVSAQQPTLTDEQKAQMANMNEEEKAAFLEKLKQQQASENKSQPSDNKSQRRGGFSGRGGRFGATSSATVDSLLLTPDDWSAQMIVFGKAFSYRQRQMLSAFNSEVTGIAVSAGQRVESGQLLLTLDDEDLQRSLAQAQNQLTGIDAQIRLQRLQASADEENLKIEQQLLAIRQAALKRYEDLNNLQLSSSNDYETALMSYQNQLKAVQAQQLAIARHDDVMTQLTTQRREQQLSVEQLQAQLADARLEAPFDGVVATVPVSVGDQVTQNQLLISVFDDQQLGLETKIPLAQAQRMHDQPKGVRAETTVGSQTVALEMTDLESLAVSGSLTAKFRFVSAVNIALGEHQPLTIQMPAQSGVFAAPASSLYENRLIYKIERQALVDTEVKVIGQTLVDGNTWYIFDSAELNAGDRILVTRLPNASRGLNVSLPANEQGQDRS